MILDVARVISQQDIIQSFESFSQQGQSFYRIVQTLQLKLERYLSEVDDNDFEGKRDAVERLISESESMFTSSGFADNRVTVFRLFLAMLSNFYGSLHYLTWFENASATAEIHWSVLYSAVDYIEGAILRIKQVQNLVQDIAGLKPIVIFFEKVLHDISIQIIDSVPEDARFQNEQVAIRRATFSALYLIDLVKEQELYYSTQRSQDLEMMDDFISVPPKEVKTIKVKLVKLPEKMKPSPYLLCD